MKEKMKKYINASFTIETTYISVLIFLSLFFIIYLTFSIYNVSVLTSNANLVLLEKSECINDENEKIEKELFEKACKVADKKTVSVERLNVETKTNFNKVSIIYTFKTKVPIKERLNEVFYKSNWEYKIKAETSRIRMEESLRLMKAILGGIKK